MGGEQTDAYIFHPGDLVVPPTRNSYEIKAILDSRRGLPGPTPMDRAREARAAEPPSLGLWLKGLSRVGHWLGLAAGALGLRREAYEKIADDQAMTGPAILIMILAQVVQSTLAVGRFDALDVAGRCLTWLVAVVLLALATRFLRGRATFSAIFRVAAFAQTAQMIELLAFLPVGGVLARFLSVTLAFFGVWIGTAAANRMRGWRTALLPLVYLATVVVGALFLNAARTGVDVILESVESILGLRAS
jgi:hypothetical protein